MNTSIVAKLVLFFLGSLLIACTDKGKLCHHLLQGRTMGTSYLIKLSMPCATDITEIAQLTEEKLLAINKKMSNWLPDSELMQLNDAATNTPIATSTELFQILQTAQDISIMTAGNFDVTIGPLVNLWGFGSDTTSEQNFIPPKIRRITSLQQNVGYQLLVLDAEKMTVKKLQPDVYVDLSAIAKGYGVDELANLLEQRNVAHYLVEIGGELRTRGNNPEGNIWRVGIEKPLEGRRKVQRLISLSDMAMATSGDYRNYNEYADTHYPHIIDPESGQPVQHALTSVTVLHPQTTWADALATALLVMGQEQAMHFAVQHDLAVFLIYRDEGGFVENWSPAMNPYLQTSLPVQ